MGCARGVLLALLFLPALGASAMAAPPLGDELRLVSFASEAPLVGSLVGGARVVESFPFARVALVQGAPDALARLASVPGVAGVYRDEPLTPALDQVRQAVRAEAPAVAAGLTGSGVTVALVDSGIDFTHPGFAGRVLADVRITKSGLVLPGEGDVDGHGTHVAGIVAGSGARSADDHLRGLAPAASLVGVDISDAFTTTSAVRAFEWIHEHRAEHGIRVVTNSWGREKADAHYDVDDPVIRASDALVADGIVVVFSAGNRGRDGQATLTSEAMNPNVLTVGASTLGGKPESYSSKGPARAADGARLAWTKPDLVAPGTAIVSARTSHGAPSGSDEERYYVMMNGTSMAAPQVAAAAALLLQARPELTPDLVAEVLVRTARDTGAPGPDDEAGHGLLDVGAALEAARGLGTEERVLVVERRVPVRVDGSVASAGALVVLSSGAPRLPPGERIDVPLPLPAGASRVDLWFNWTGPGEFDVRLEGPGGSVPFTVERQGSLALRRGVEPGAYSLVVRPVGVASHTTFSAEGSALVREEHVVEAPAEFHSRSGARPTGGFLPASGGPMAPLLANAERGVALVVALSCCLALVTLRPRR